jgi:hypothetical protein
VPANAVLLFGLYPLRFEFVAKEPLYFPPGKAANIFRGALGVIFRRTACALHCPGVRACAKRDSCLYARIFEPRANAEGPSGLADRPRPFVFRARNLDGATIGPGAAFHFDLNLFLMEQSALECFVSAFAAIAEEGLGPRRGKAELQRVTCGNVIVYDTECKARSLAPQPVTLDLTTTAIARDRVRVEFLSPTELKHENRIAGRPEFPILFGRIRDRVSTLSRLYGAGNLDVDYVGTNERAARVRMTACEVRRQETTRRSTKTGQVHSIGGFVGFAEYEGDLAEFLPWLSVAHWTGVGRQAVWGKGEIATNLIS